MTRKRERDEKRREERERENGKLALLLRLQPVHHHPLLLYYFTHLLPTVKPVLLYSFYYLLRSFSTQALLPKPYTLHFQQSFSRELNSLTVFSRADTHKQHTSLKEKETMAIAAGYGNSKFVDDAQVRYTFF